MPRKDKMYNKNQNSLLYKCQLAHGSTTGYITGFCSASELYCKIAECYHIPAENILYCTLNTPKVDMHNLLLNQIGLDDFIFAHVKGQPKEVELIKTEATMGVTISDNGANYAFIKRLRDDGLVKRSGYIFAGDVIEKINGISMVSKRHLEVSKWLKDIPVGAKFTMRVIEPLKSGFQAIAPPSRANGSGDCKYGTGKKTLRFCANGCVEIGESQDERTKAAIDALNVVLDNIYGINDDELAAQIWELGNDKSNSLEFTEAINNSVFSSWEFNKDFIIDFWGAITDARTKKTKKK